MNATLTPGSLSEVMDFDHVIEVHPDGTVSDRRDIFAPELFDGEVWGGWTLLTGYSGQDRYSGPIMHPSEYIGGRMERDILSTPGVYVSLVAVYICDECDGSEDGCEFCENGTGIEGWAVARLDDDDSV